MFVTVHAVIESQGGGYICNITYLSKDKEEIMGRERQHVCIHACVCVSVRERDFSGFGRGPSVGMFALDMTFGVT